MPKSAKRSPKRTTQRDGKLIKSGDMVQVYTRLKPADAEKLRELAAADERPVMVYLRRMIEQHLEKAS